MTCPNPGIYLHIPPSEYRAWDALNKSSLDVLQEQSPLHYQYRLTHPEPATPALSLGSAFHTLALEGEEQYEKDFVFGGPINSKTGRCYGVDTQAFAQWAASLPPGKQFLTTDTSVLVREMVHAILSDDTAGPFVLDKFNGSANEASLVWQDEATGLMCKARADMIRPGWESIGDLKTTEDASPRGFSQSIGTYGYHRQAAWYLDGAAAVYKATGDERLKSLSHFPFVCVEKKPPFAVAVYVIKPADVEIGRCQNRRLIDLVKACRESGKWPGYGNGFADIGLRDYAAREMIRELNDGL